MVRGKLFLLLAVAAMFCFTETAAYDYYNDNDYGNVLQCYDCDGCQQPVNYFLVAVYRIFLVFNVQRELAVVYSPLFLHFFVFVVVRICGVSVGLVQVVYRGMNSLIGRLSGHQIFGKYVRDCTKTFTDCVGPIGWKLEY